MPVYDYKCQACGRQFEQMQKFSDPPLTRCGACGGTLIKLLSPPALVFKGSGWYITDYSRKGGSKDGSDKSSDSKGSGGDKAKQAGTGQSASDRSSTSSPPSHSPKKDKDKSE